MPYVVIGVGLIGSEIAVMTPHDNLIVIDDDSFSEKHRILACYSDGLKVKAIEAYRESHGMSKVIAAIPHRFEELGDGFLTWCASQGAILLDATDGLISSGNIGHASRRFGLPVVTGKVSGSNGIVRVFPGNDNVGFCCLNLKGNSSYVSCFGIQTAELVAPTNASMAVASAVSAIMVTAAENIRSVEEAYEIRIDLDRIELRRSHLRVAPCQEHTQSQVDAVEFFSIDANSYQLSISDLIDHAKKLSDNSDLVLDPPLPLASSFVCGECRRIQTAYRFVGSRVFRCKCGANMLVQQDSLWQNSQGITSDDARGMQGSLFDLGLPLWHRYKLYNQDRTIILEVSGDRCLLIKLSETMRNQGLSMK